MLAFVALTLTACLYIDACGTHGRAIHDMVAQDVMHADNSTFRTSEPATRQETAVAIAALFELSPANSQAFPDIDGPAGVAADSLAAEGIIQGFTDGTFRPDRHVTRGQLATMLDRTVHLGEKRPQVPPPPFSDVQLDVGHGTSVAWLHATGAVSGFPDGTFRQHAPVTRGQLATILHRKQLDGSCVSVLAHLKVGKDANA